MTKSVSRKSKSRKLQTLLQVFTVPEDVTLTQLQTGFRTEKVRRVALELVDSFPQLLGKGNEPIFISLSTNGENQIVQIYIRHTKGQALIDSEASIYKRKDYRLETPICPGCGNPVYNPAHLLNCRGY